MSLGKSCCPSRLRKRDEYESPYTENQKSKYETEGLSVYAYQFLGQHDGLSNEQKDAAIVNRGIVPDSERLYGQAFHGKILPPSKRFGPFEYQQPNGTYVNPFRYSNDVCFGIGDCREYADKLERYMKCREQNMKQGIEHVTKVCGPPPKAPGQFAQFASFVFPWN